MEGKRPLKEEEDSLSISESGPVAVPLDEPSAKRLRTAEPTSLDSNASNSEDDDDEDEDVATQNALTGSYAYFDSAGETVLASGNSKPQEEEEGMDVDGVALRPVLAKETEPFKFLNMSWAEQVSKLHPVKCELHVLSDQLAAPFGCTLTVTLPDSTSQVFTVPTVYFERRLARDAAAKEILDAGVLEAAKVMREAAGPEQVVEGDEYDKLASPWIDLNQIFQRCMPIGPLDLQYSCDLLNVTHGATITIPVTADSSESFEVLTTMQSRKVAKEEASRRALRSGIAERLESAFKARLVVDSGGYLTFNGGESDAAGLDPAASLAKEVKELMGSDKSLVWTPKSSLVTKGSQSFGCQLDINIGADFHRNFTVPLKYRGKKDAKMAVAAAAFKAGLMDELKAAKAANPNFGGITRTIEKKVPKTPAPTVAGTVAKEDLQSMDNAVSYIHLCFQQWTNLPNPLDFTFDFDGETKEHTAKLKITLHPKDIREYAITNGTTRKSAKEDVTKLAFADGILDIIKAKAKQPGAPAVRGGAVRGALRGTRGVGRGDFVAAGRGAVRGGRGGMMGPSGGQQMPQFPNQQFQQQQFPYQQQQPQQFQHPSPYFNQQQQGPAYGASRFQPPQYQQQQQQQQPQQYGGSLGQSGPDFVKNLDDFCQNWMGPGHLPNYEIRQNEQSGYFGAVVRVSVGPSNIKAFWVDQDFVNRGDAQEAVARIAVQDGLYEQIKQEFIPQNNGPQRSNFPPSYPQNNLQGPPHMQNQGYSVPPQTNRFPSQGFAPPPRPQQQQQQQQQQHNNQRPMPPHQEKGRPNAAPVSLRSTPGGPPLPPQLGAIGGATTAKAITKVNGTSPASASKKATPVKSTLAPEAAATPAPGVASIPTPASDKKKGGEKSYSDRAFNSLNRSCSVLLGDDKTASYEVDEDSANSRFGASLTIPIGSNKMYFATGTIHSTKQAAKEAVAAIALSKNVINLMREEAAKTWSQSSSAVPDASIPVASAPSISSVPPTPVAISSGAAKVIPAVVPVVAPVAPVTPVVPVASVAPAVPAPTPVLPVAPAPVPVVASVATVPVASVPASLPAATVSTTKKVSSNGFGKGKRVSSVLALEEFCRTHNKEPPTFFEDPVQARVHCILGEQKFELPSPQGPEGKEKLAARVLGHFTKELAAKK